MAASSLSRFGRVSERLLHRRAQQDLDVDLVVRGVDAGRVVDEVGIDAPARQRVLDAAELGDAEIGALADHAGAHLAPVDAQRVVGAVADLGMRLAVRLDVGADAAEPQQVHLGAASMARISSAGVTLSLPRPKAVRIASVTAIDLARAVEHAAALGDQLRVVVRPGRARQAEQPLALGEARLRVGIGVDEDVQVVERADQLDVPRQQHAVAEHVARHVADADDGEVLGLDVDAHLAEMALDRFPRAARGDAHLLVVVAGRAARGEGVAEPEAVVGGDPVGDVGEGRRALVGRDHQIGVVAVAAAPRSRAAPPCRAPDCR